jgi:acyl carrier protein phosphodiesterase
LKYNQTTLTKLEKILDEAGYIVRYERGSFQSGYCILEDKKVVVLNKFLIREGRINTLIDILPSLTVNYDALTHDSQKLYDEVMSQAQKLEK